MNLSYWERKTFLSNINYAIVGSGIVGLSCALSLRKKFPKGKIAVFEKGMLPSGASTKNAGFACFGSVSEILDDLTTHSEEEVIGLVRKRVEGLELLRNNLSDQRIDYQQLGGYELFTTTEEEFFDNCISKVPYINDLLKEVFLNKEEVFSIIEDKFSFKNIKNRLIFNRLEGQIDTGSMMQGLIEKCAQQDILILNGAKISSFSSEQDAVNCLLNDSEAFKVDQLFIATNGFAKQLLKQDVAPARAQVLITRPIPGLKIEGTFHLDKGYYYFRNIDNRILFGGGRNLDFKAEETSQLGLTKLVQKQLETILKTTILPNTTFEIDSRWSGIMGVGTQKNPIVQTLAPRVHCGVRLGGMGVAIGSSVGVQLAQLSL